MKRAFYILILVCLYSCKSTKLVSESESISKKTELEFYENGFLKSIGQIDSDYLTKAARFGLWSQFYENGKLKETGEYKTDSYVNCCTAGPCGIIYSYKIGEWNYYYPNGKLKSKGVYRIGEKNIVTSCEGGDEINFGFVTDEWIFYDSEGKKIKPTKKDIIDIEKSSYLNEADMRNR
ncbi:toxin-antitoxin system YwqK family antitoxin [Changchengzhania lutea]|uniref:toxin-antitoxin system YwqK family antitoxin n=1 Tax=Changchengzhania lutea TaxID=2049305 RepID=UPI00115C467A|nr:hypothetical protein [Changchengzhania lutea]